MNNDDYRWLKFRIETVCIFFLVLFTIIFARAIQLTFLSPGLIEIANMQRQKAIETTVLMKEFQENINKLKALSLSYDILLEKLQYSDNVRLSMERRKLLKEINELKSQHQKLSKEVQSLQDSLSNLSKMEERGVQQIINAYNRLQNSEKRFDFFVNFLMGVIASIIGSIIYKSVAIRYNLVSRDMFNQLIKKMLHIRKRPGA